MNRIDRRKALQLSLLAPIASSLLGCKSSTRPLAAREALPPNSLTPPADTPIPVAFLLSEGAVVIDFCGPWEVFLRAPKPKGTYPAFKLYTVAETASPIRTGDQGFRLVPDYTIDNAPQPKVIVIPAQSPASEKTKAWIREASKHTDVTMSVCTGAFVLASTGLLRGKPATTHHIAYADLAAEYPDIHVQRGARFVESGNLATAGGLTSGMDLALRVVQRYFGEDAVRDTANMLEYQGEGWLHPDSNAAFDKAIAQSSTRKDGRPRCAVCGMEADQSIASVYNGKTYSFCMRQHKKLFEASPGQFVTAEVTR